MVAPLFKVVERSLCTMLEDACKNIPSQFEKLMVSKNISSIKTTVFCGRSGLSEQRVCPHMAALVAEIEKKVLAAAVQETFSQIWTADS